MESHQERGYATVDVTLPASLWNDLDAYAVAHGYRTVDAVVAEAIEQHAD